MEVRMELSRIIISETSDQQVIVLQEQGGKRSFPIMIGLWEAIAIDRNIKSKKTPRPMPHDLIENVIHGLNATLERIVVSDLQESTFYARLVIRKNGSTIDIDSRPSDAIALAVQMSVPIYVEEKVIVAVNAMQEKSEEGWELPGEKEA